MFGSLLALGKKDGQDSLGRSWSVDLEIRTNPYRNSWANPVHAQESELEGREDVEIGPLNEKINYFEG